MARFEAFTLVCQLVCQAVMPGRALFHVNACFCAGGRRDAHEHSECHPGTIKWSTQRDANCKSNCHAVCAAFHRAELHALCAAVQLTSRVPLWVPLGHAQRHTLQQP